MQEPSEPLTKRMCHGAGTSSPRRLNGVTELDISDAYCNLRGWRVLADPQRYMTWNKRYMPPQLCGPIYVSKKAAMLAGYEGELMKDAYKRSESCPLYGELRILASNPNPNNTPGFNPNPGPNLSPNCNHKDKGNRRESKHNE